MNNLSDKLAKIKKKTGMSNEKIAQELGVSISTLYRWLTRKNEPMRAHTDLIKKWVENYENAS